MFAILGSSRAWLYLVLLIGTLVDFAFGNVEKIIFTGPPPSGKAGIDPRLASLTNINSLTHNEFSIRTNLDRFFAPEEAGARGQSSWVLLTNLTENQRYELRVCWSALEPTRFDMEAYSLDAFLQSPKLLRSLETYAASRQSDQETTKAAIFADSPLLLVEIHSAADYFTDDAELMTNPPPVLVDLILDPFLFNVLPQSLLPTVCYLVLIGITSWFIARWVASSLLSVAGSATSPAKKKI